ncbi:Integral membrane protein, partial [Pleurostoma richardsiae]
GAAIVNGTLVYSAVCHNCHSWPGGGTLDVQSSAVKAIYATGPSGLGKSNHRAAPLKYHSDYGSFTIDMRSALGSAAAPVLDGKSLSAGTTLHDSESGQRDWVAIIHAVVMVFCFMGLMPFGVVILRVGEWVRWHGVNQGIAMVGVICGFGLGVKTGLLYIRSKNFSSAHQVVGLIVTVSIVVQFLLGFFHHRIYKNTEQPTKLAPIHVWLGRVTVVLGIFNCFLGFPLAVESKYNYVLAGLVIAIVSIMFFILFWKRVFRCRRERQRMAPIQVAYDPHPWRNTAPSNYGRWLPDQQQNGNGMDDVTLSTLDRAHGETKVETNARTRSLELY